ncbi:ParB/RepB/Spo0J family partition protein [Acrocarpospora catenulata]|uniref:ParB/RepB/Spo0J family partition protein n=1 Tax=Acrocarpospora catenulata TaxID=2836182 RepID=UPI001BDA2C9E|nr:ParB/RepB/Spo0J family partition protein [Acrocarpospora catenulata]
MRAPDSPAGGSEHTCRVQIASLRPADSPRLSGEDADHLIRLAGLETSLPPILVHRQTMRVIDGMHRLRAAALRGQDTIEVRFFDGSEADAFVRAVQENVAHGLPLTLADRKAAAERIIASHPTLSDRAIAQCTGLAAKTVGGVRRRSSADSPQSNERLGVDGRLRPLDGGEGRRRASEVIAARPDASIREIAAAAGVSLGTAHDVRARILRGADPERPKPPAGRPPKERTDPTDRPAILQTLRKDPSLRLTDPGRELLRLLHSRAIAVGDWRDLVDAVPAHCMDSVARLARDCAEAWGQFATELQRRESAR